MLGVVRSSFAYRFENGRREEEGRTRRLRCLSLQRRSPRVGACTLQEGQRNSLLNIQPNSDRQLKFRAECGISLDVR